MWWSRARLQPSGLNSLHRRSPCLPATAQVSFGAPNPPHFSVPQVLPFSPLFCLNLPLPLAAVRSSLPFSFPSVPPVLAPFEAICVGGMERVFGCFCLSVFLEVIESKAVQFIVLLISCR